MKTTLYASATHGSKSDLPRVAAGAAARTARAVISALGSRAVPVGIAAAVLTPAAMALEAHGIAALASITGLSVVAAGDSRMNNVSNRNDSGYNE